MNIAVQCPHCGTVYDATGGGAGTFDTGPDGRLRLRDAVREATAAIFSSGPVETLAVEELLSSLRTASTPGEIAAASGGRFPAFEAWARKNPAKVKIVEGFLTVVLSVLLTRAVTPEPPPVPAPQVHVTTVIEQPSDDEVQRLVEEELDKREGKQSPG